MIDVRLRSDVSAPGAARQALAELSERVDDPVFEDIRLLVSELVTNGVRHTNQGPAGWVELTIRWDPRRVRVEVRDPGPGFGEVRAPSIYQESGWGLYLVEQVASRWGVDRSHGNTVWFEIDCPVRVA
ncbi:MAG TPA: ATP-binding protein [Actinomycetota bacterium]|nr:ATP-binding protein [Actinomycetota bacterium]